MVRKTVEQLLIEVNNRLADNSEISPLVLRNIVTNIINSLASKDELVAETKQTILQKLEISEDNLTNMLVNAMADHSDLPILLTFTRQDGSTVDLTINAP